MSTPEQFTKFRELMLAAVNGMPEDAAVWLSGGVDSATILFAALELGRKPTCFTFMVEGIESRDLRASRSIAKRLGLQWHSVVIPADPVTVVSDVRRVLSVIEHPRKVHVQCCHAYMRIALATVGAGITDAIVGLSAGDLFADGKEITIALHRHGEEHAREMRREDFVNPLDSNIALRHIASQFGVTLHLPFRDHDLSEFCFSLDLADINKPKQKHLAVMAFADWWRRGKWYRTNDPFQVGSCLRELHDRVILKDPMLNRGGSKAVAAVYRAMKRGEV